MCKTVFVAKLLGGIDDVLGNKFYVPGQKERVVVHSSSMTPPFSFTGLLSIALGSGSVFGGALGSPGGQSIARVAGDVLYVAAQASALMVAAADRVFRASVNEIQLKTFQGSMESIREELHDSEAEPRVLSEHNCIVDCEKAALEDHVATLEGRIERLE
ncbi:unnamed protein product [Lactuca saligna]|uniref:Uncharacterized protein n=1 Tax=Lactuca saligna TaxID=75948 RepID=A0AA36A4J5_LACSI|nr:unnamed protein product [Lactuca saligna]